MKIVVPIAGPDFEKGDGTVKAERTFEGMPLLRCALESRSWWRRGECRGGDLVFVLRDTRVNRAFIDRSLLKWYPDSRIVWLSHLTQGAALSALAGVAAIAHIDEILVVDLVDIVFDEDCPLASLFGADSSLGGLALTFESSAPIYSYLSLDSDGNVKEAAEKLVISSHASAGVYAFKSPAVYLNALADNLQNPQGNTYRELFFLCPVFNGVVASGLSVRTACVTHVRDPKFV